MSARKEVKCVAELKEACGQLSAEFVVLDFVGFHRDNLFELPQPPVGGVIDAIVIPFEDGATLMLRRVFLW